MASERVLGPEAPGVHAFPDAAVVVHGGAGQRHRAITLAEQIEIRPARRADDQRCGTMVRRVSGGEWWRGRARNVRSGAVLVVARFELALFCEDRPASFERAQDMRTRQPLQRMYTLVSKVYRSMQPSESDATEQA